MQSALKIAIPRSALEQDMSLPVRFIGTGFKLIPEWDDSVC